MSSMNDEVSELKNKIIECQEETLQLLHENQCLRDKYNLVEQAKQRAVADLSRQIRCNLIETSKFEKELEALSKSLKRTEKTASVLEKLYDERQVHYAEYKKTKEMHLIESERALEKLESMTDKDADAKLYKSRIEMEKRLESLNVFCEAVYSTLKSKDSGSVSFVKEAQIDHPGGQKMRQRQGSKGVSVTVA